MGSLVAGHRRVQVHRLIRVGRPAIELSVPRQAGGQVIQDTGDESLAPDGTDR